VKSIVLDILDYAIQIWIRTDLMRKIRFVKWKTSSKYKYILYCL